MAWIEPTEQVNGNVLDDQLWNQDVVANTLAIFRYLTPVGTVIPYAGDWGTDYVNLADPDVGAPFHLPCNGSAHRLHPVTTAHMIHERLADPNLTDEERERLEAQLNGEPWPPMPEEVS